jgi:hypothetical protein
MQKKHLDQAKSGGWPVIDLGDVFDAMQGKRDPRASRLNMKACLSEKEEYFDLLVDYAHEFFKPYAQNMALIGLGNHETSILKHNETHLLKRLASRLETPVLGAYSGWVKVMFEGHGSQRRRSVNIRYTHGSGGSAPVTKGVIHTNRRAVYLPDAHILLSGHSHESFMVPLGRERISDAGEVYKDEQLHVQVPSYKDETTGISNGYALERGMATTTTGAVWLKFWFNRTENKIKWDAERAR